MIAFGWFSQRNKKRADILNLEIREAIKKKAEDEEKARKREEIARANAGK